MASLSDFQKKKILRVFSTFFDINNDGVIEWQDFEIAAEKVRGLHGWPADGEKHKEAVASLQMVWEGLKQFADENKDDKICQEEWSNMWAANLPTLSSNNALPEWQQKYMDFMFDVNDTSGDGKIDVSEYTTVYTSYGLSPEQAAAAFNTICPDANGGTLGREDFYALWRKYFTSDNAEEPANSLFGIIQ